MVLERIYKETEEKMKKSLEIFKEELAKIRAGVASPAILDVVKVEYYGEEMPVKQLATISVPEPRLIVIQPWDKNSLPEIEKAIWRANLGLNPSNDGSIIRIHIPELTDERRKELVKLVKTEAEHAKVSVRNVRREAIEKLRKAKKDSKITEDDERKGEEKIQKITDKYIEEVSKIAEAKEEEINK